MVAPSLSMQELKIKNEILNETYIVDSFTFDLNNDISVDFVSGVR